MGVLSSITLKRVITSRNLSITVKHLSVCTEKCLAVLPRAIFGVESMVSVVWLGLTSCAD